MRLEDIVVGQSAEFGKTITEADVALFAGITGDFNPVHVDAVAAARSRFGGRIAHGMLSAGLISATLASRLPGPGSIYLTQTLRFTAPVRIGDTVTARVSVVEIIAPKRRVRLSTVCRNQDGLTVLDGEATVLVPEEISDSSGTSLKTSEASAAVTT
ncbi:MAG: MaoC family dehydratase [Gemmatimonadaceae bacterium]